MRKRGLISDTLTPSFDRIEKDNNVNNHNNYDDGDATTDLYGQVRAPEEANYNAYLHQSPKNIVDRHQNRFDEDVIYDGNKNTIGGEGNEQLNVKQVIDQVTHIE